MQLIQVNKILSMRQINDRRQCREKKINLLKQPLSHVPEYLDPKAVPHNCSKCLFLQKSHSQEKKVVQSVSIFFACYTKVQCSEVKRDQDMLRLLLGEGNEVKYHLSIAAEVKYHKTSLACHVRKTNAKSLSFKKDEKK